MTETPKFAHHWHGAVFLGRISLNGVTLDTYSHSKKAGILFAYGCEPYEYFSTPVTTFPIQAQREHVAKASRMCLTASVLNTAWAEARRRWWK